MLDHSLARYGFLGAIVDVQKWSLVKAAGDWVKSKASSIDLAVASVVPSEPKPKLCGIDEITVIGTWNPRLA